MLTENIVGEAINTFINLLPDKDVSRCRCQLPDSIVTPITPSFQNFCIVLSRIGRYKPISPIDQVNN